MDNTFPVQYFSDGKIVLNNKEFIILMRRQGANSRTVLELSYNGELYYLAVYDNKNHLALLLKAFNDLTTVPVIDPLTNKTVEAIIFGDFIEEVTGLEVDA